MSSCRLVSIEKEVGNCHQSYSTMRSFVIKLSPNTSVCAYIYSVSGSSLHIRICQSVSLQILQLSELPNRRVSADSRLVLHHRNSDT